MVGVDATERSSRCVLKRARPPVRKDAPVLAVSNAGFQIAYEVVGRGSGPGLLFAQSKVGWSRMGYVEVLKERGKVLVVDPRVYGDSSRATREADYSLGAFYDDLLAAADAVGLDQFCRVGLLEHGRPPSRWRSPPGPTESWVWSALAWTRS